MKKSSTTPKVLPSTNLGAVGKAWDEVSGSFDRFCLAAGVEALGAMMEKDAEDACGARHARKAFKQLPALRAALAAHYETDTNNGAVAQRKKAA